MANLSTVAIANVQTQDKDINQLQSNISGALNKFQVGLTSTVSDLSTSIESLQSSSFISGTILSGKLLAVGDNTITHGLGKSLTGWVIVRQRAAAQIYDKQDSNTIPQTTLVLNASASVTVDIYVF